MPDEVVETYRGGFGSSTFEDQPVNYTGQINMMQDIFK